MVRGKVCDINIAYLTKELDPAIGVEQAGVYIIPKVGYYTDSIPATLTLLSKITDVAQIRDSFDSDFADTYIDGICRQSLAT